MDELDLLTGEESPDWLRAGIARTIRRLPAAEYHAMLVRSSSSMLKHMLVSPAHYLAATIARHVESPAMKFGSLIHLLVLEPWQLPFEYVVVAEIPRGREARALREMYPRHAVITEVELHDARALAQRIMERKVLGRPFQRFVEEGEPELTFLFDDPVVGLPCRTRVDLWHPDFIFDLKTTRHATSGEFQRAALDLHYDLQAYMYCLADAVVEQRSKARPFVFIAAQSDEPHPVHALSAGDTFMENGRAKYQHAIGLLKACLETDYWPDTSADGVLEIEPWQQFAPAGQRR